MNVYVDLEVLQHNPAGRGHARATTLRTFPASFCRLEEQALMSGEDKRVIRLRAYDRQKRANNCPSARYHDRKFRANSRRIASLA